MVIENMTGVFEIEKFENEYKNKIMKAINDKIAGKKITKADAGIVKPHNVINLMDATQSLNKQNQKKLK